MTTTQDKREYFRVNDQLLIHCCLEGTATSEPSPEDSLETPELKQLSSLSQDLGSLINAVHAEQQTIAKALGLLNQRQQILERLVMGRTHAHPDYELVTANISGAGIAFLGQTAFSKGDRVRIAMIFQPSQIEVVIHGAIVDCVESGDAYQLRIDFDEDEFAREQIIQHVVQRQS